MENDIKALADAIYRDKVRRAREAPPTRKMGWGAELFQDASDRMRCGIRVQFGDLPPEEVEALLRKREKDTADVRDVIAVQGDEALDWEYIHGWCDVHGTRGLLEQIRDSIPPLD
jgi:hypothetical protein